MIWTGNRRTVSTPNEVEAALDEILAQAAVSVLPLAVTVIPPSGSDHSPFDEDFPDCLEVGLGHPDRAFVRWIGAGGGYGYEPALTAGPADVRFDYGGQPIHPDPHELRVSPSVARRAVHEFAATGKRPNLLQWLREGDDNR
ncbi:Imm1 family immunity protein [Micromonospora polyrhachis]|uniref:Imm1 family immunity protein n=1 Tax=Micromonospora polyrhachis TaxID=1282883 RepID=UPI0035E44177